MKKVYKIIAGTSIVAIPTATTLGVVYGTKEAKDNYLAKTAESFGEKLFDSKMKEAGASYAAAHLLNPTGGYNLTHLIRLDSNMDSDHAHNFIARTADGQESPALIRVSVPVSKALRADQLEAFFVEANNKIGKYISSIKDQKQRESLGVYVGKNSVTREITAAIYKVKSVSDADKDKMNAYWNDFGDIAQAPFSPSNPNAFLQLFGAQCLLTPRQKDYYQFNFDQAAMENKYEYKTFTVKEWNDAHPEQFKMYDGSDSSTSHHTIMNSLAKDNLIPTYEPIIDLKNHQLKVILRGWKLDKTSQVRYLDGDQAFNPIGVYTKIITYDLNNLGSTTSVKTPENRALLKNFLSKTIYKYVTYKTIEPGLEILGAAIPSLRSFAEEFMRVSKLLGQKQGVYTDIFTDAFLDKLLDKLSSNQMVNAPAFIEVVKNFEKQAFNDNNDLNVWTNINILSRLYAYSGGQYRMYQLVTSMKTITKDIENEVFKVHREAKYIQDTSLVEELLGFLKQNNVVDPDFTLNKIIANPYGELINILFRLSENHVNISEEAAKRILPIIPIDLIANNVDGWAKALNILTTGNNLSNILKLLGDNKAEVLENIKGLLDSATIWDTAGKIIDRVKNVADVESIMALFKVIKATGILPKLFDSLLGDTPKAATTWIKLFKDGTIKALFNYIKYTFEVGLDSQIRPSSAITLSFTEAQYRTKYKPSNADYVKLNTFIDTLYSHLTDNTYTAILENIINNAQAPKENGGNMDKFNLYKYSSGAPVVVNDPGVAPVDHTSAEYNAWDLKHRQYLEYLKTKADYDTWVIDRAKASYERVTAADMKEWFRNHQDGFAEIMVYVPQVSQAVHPLTDADRTALLNYYKSAPMSVKSAFAGPSGASDEAGLLEWIKPTNPTINTEQMIFENLNECIPLNTFVTRMAPLISSIVNSIDFTSMGLGPELNSIILKFKDTIGVLLPTIIADLWLKPLDKAIQPVIDAWEDVLNQIPAAKNYIEVFKLIARLPEHGIASPFDLTEEETLPDKTKHRITPTERMARILAAIFPSGHVTGTDKDKPEDTITTAELNPFILGLLNGFNTEDDAVEAFKAIAPSLVSGDIIDEMFIRDIYTTGTITQDSMIKILLAKVFHPDLLFALHEIFKKGGGLSNLTKETYHKLFNGLEQTLNSEVLNSSLISSQITSIKPLLENLKKFITKDRITDLTEACYAVLHEPLKNATAKHYDIFIDLINATGLLKTYSIQHIGSALQHLITGGLGALTPYEWSQVLETFKLGSMTETIQKLIYGKNYKAKVVQSISQKVATMKLAMPTEVTLVTGALPLDGSLPTFAQLKATCLEKERAIQYAIDHYIADGKDVIALSEINDKMHAYVLAYEALINHNHLVAASNAKYAATITP